MSPPTYFPLRWESTGDQWWYASPIDWAAANGHYDLVRELLRLDGNHLIKLTSLRRIRRLETVWDDDAQFHDVARCRSEIAKKLLAECDTKKGKNSLIGGGYGGWLLYTAASAGDVAFVAALLERDPLLVFGEGEYGVTDILYAAARSGDSGVFKLVLDFAAAPRFGEGEGEVPAGYRVEIMNRAVHAAARGGNLGVVKELLRDCSDDALAYRDVQGATVLHAAAARGQVQVVRELASSWGLIDATDNQGNTALHVAAQRGHLAAVEALIQAFPSSITATNNAGDTFLHAVVGGFQTPGFRRLDRQMELMRHLLSGNLFPVEAIINSKNVQGKTPLHLAISSNTHSDLVELLMTVSSIDVNIRDADGDTPLDILRRRPVCASSELLTRRLVSAGGILTSQDYSARRVIASHIKRQSMGSSPGTSFRISDVEIFLYTASEGCGRSSGSPELQPAAAEAPIKAASSAAQRLRRLLHWPKTGKSAKQKVVSTPPQPQAVPLRQRFSNAKASTSLLSSNNKRTLSVRSREASPAAKKKIAAGVMHGVMQAVPAAGGSTRRSRSSSLSKLSFSSQSSVEASCSNEEGGKRSMAAVVNRRSSVMNQYLCFGGPTQGVVEAAAEQPYDLYERSVLAAA